MIRLAKGSAVTAPSSYEEEKTMLRDILAGEEYAAYASADGETGQNLLLVWLERLLKSLAELFPELSMTGTAEDALSYGIIAAGLGLLVVLSVFAARHLWAERSLRQPAAMTEEELELPPEELIKQAGECAAAGDIREATRLLFLSLLLALQREDWLEVKPWKTNWEYAEELYDRNAPWLELFRVSASQFDQVWYGHRGIAGEEFEQWLERVEAAVGGKEGTA